MIWLGLFAILAPPSAPQDRPVAPLVRGVFQEWSGSSTSGVFVFRTSDDNTYRCAFSGKTYFERDHKRASITTFEPGQPMELLSERIPDPPLCRALIVRHVIENPSNAARARVRPFSTAGEPIIPRGNLLYTGVVVRTEDEALLLRTRAGQSHWIQLRQDTRFSNNGSPTGRHEIPDNRPVQVRAGRTFENLVEAYSIVWGEILRP